MLLGRSTGVPPVEKIENSARRGVTRRVAPTIVSLILHCLQFHFVGDLSSGGFVGNQ